MPVDRVLTFTRYSNAKSTNGTTLELPWTQWCQALSEFEDAPDDSNDSKLAGPAVVLGMVRGGRSKKNVVFCEAIGIDLDSANAAELQWVLNEPLAQYAYHAYTTFSHRSENPRVRIILPFDQPLAPSEYPWAWAGVNSIISGLNDPQTKDESRMHFTPRSPITTKAERSVITNPGRLFSPKKDLADFVYKIDAPEVVGASRYKGKRITVEHLRDLIRRTRNSSSLKGTWLRVLEGDEYAQEGHRHEVNLRLTMDLAYRYGTELTLDVLEDLFDKSLARMKAMHSDPPEDAEAIFGMYETACIKINDRDTEYQKRVREDQERQAFEAQIKAVNTEPAAEDDYSRIVEVQGWDPRDEACRNRWFLSHDRQFWVLTKNGGYSRSVNNADDLVLLARDYLSCFPEVRLREMNSEGRMRVRSFKEIMYDHGTAVNVVKSTNLTQRSWYDPETKTLHDALSPHRDLTPHFDPKIDEWLRALAGAQYEKLNKWITCFPDLNKLLCGLYINAPAGVGKNLLAQGLARIWTTSGPAKAAIVLGNFSEDITRCPLIWADEDLPVKVGTQLTTAFVRELVGSKSHSLARKGRTETQLEGAIRLIITANNADMLKGHSTMTNEDIDAIAERFMLITASDDARKYLDGVDNRTKDAWVHDGIAAHALYLQQHQSVDKGTKDRFWVMGDAAAMRSHLIASNNVRSLIIRWILGYLSQPDVYEAKREGLIFRNKGRLYINQRAIADNWDLYVSDDFKPPYPMELRRALASISRDKLVRRRVRNEHPRYREVTIDDLLDYAETHGYDRGLLLANLAENSPDDPDGKQIPTHVSADVH